MHPFISISFIIFFPRISKSRQTSLLSKMSFTISTNFLQPLEVSNLKSSSRSKLTSAIVCSSASTDEKSNNSSLKALSAALALSSILVSSTVAVLPASADISGLTPCKESKQFAKREKQSLKKLESSLKLYAPDSAPALAIKATMEKTKRRFDNYGKQGLLCGSDGLPHLIVSGDQRHWGEFITPGILFLYIAGWIGWVGRSYLIAIRDEKKPTQKEIIIDVPLASRLVFRGFSWPVAAYREFLNGELIDPTV
ncbi:putative photosystem I [Helianthus debilis subsp. tardiflorus]